MASFGCGDWFDFGILPNLDAMANLVNWASNEADGNEAVEPKLEAYP